MQSKELSWRERVRLWLRLGIRLVLAVAVALIYLAPPLLSLFMPFVLAFLLAWLLNPLVRLIQKRLGISRQILSLLLILLILGVAGGILVVFIWNIVSELMALANNYQEVIAQFQEAASAASIYFSRALGLVPEEVLAFGNGMLTQL